MAFVEWQESLEVVKSSTGSKSSSCSVTISKNFGTASFSGAAVDLMGIKADSHIKCFVDKENNKIGFKVVSKKGEFTAEVNTRSTPKGEGVIHSIKIKAILVKIGFDKEEAYIYDLKKNELDSDLFEADLKVGMPKYKKKKNSDAE